MFKNYLKVAIRNLLKHKTYSVINISGLAVGMACCILILLWVKNELSYDQHHENRSRVYRVVADFHSETGTRNFARTAPLLAPTLKKDFPEIEQAIRFKKYSGAVEYKDKQFQEKDFFFVDAGVFEMFTFSFLKGGPGALKDPHTIVLTESMAQKYFGSEDPIGKVMFAADTINLKVIGVIEDLPSTTHFNFQFLASFVTWVNIKPERQLNTWANNIYYTYIMLVEDFPATELVQKLPAFADQYINDADSGLRETLSLQPITDIHLKSNRQGELQPNGQIAYVYIFSLIAVMVLAIACINFMNLTSARSINRNKEVGLRKVVGATRPHLLRQFLGESILMSSIAFILAIFLVEMVLPVFNSISGKELHFGIFDNLGYIFGLIALALIVGLAAGSYPAILLSGFQPAGIFKGAGKTDSKGIALRKGLVIFQFAISIILIIGSIVVSG